MVIFPEYRGKGLTNIFVEAVVAIATQRCFDYLHLVASAPASYHVFKNKFGFQEIASVKYSEYSESEFYSPKESVIKSFREHEPQLWCLVKKLLQDDQ